MKWFEAHPGGSSQMFYVNPAHVSLLVVRSPTSALVHVETGGNTTAFVVEHDTPEEHQAALQAAGVIE